MDPDEALKLIRRLYKRALGGAVPSHQKAYALVALSEYIESLDEWLSKGGFPPKAWAKR